MIRWTGLAPWEFEFPVPGSFTFAFQTRGGPLQGTRATRPHSVSPTVVPLAIHLVAVVHLVIRLVAVVHLAIESVAGVHLAIQLVAVVHLAIHLACLARATCPLRLGLDALAPCGWQWQRRLPQVLPAPKVVSPRETDRIVSKSGRFVRRAAGRRAAGGPQAALP